MNSTAKQVIVSLVAAGAAVGVYHGTIGSSSRTVYTVTKEGTSGDAVAALRSRVEALEQALSERDAPVAGPAGGAEEVERLRARVEALEGRLVSRSAEAGASPGARLPEEARPERRTLWTEDQVDAFRSLMDEVDRRRVRDRETASIREMVRGIDPNISSKDENAVVSLLTGFQESLRTLYPGGSAGNTPEEREATVAKAREAKAKVEAEIRAILPPEKADRIAKYLPAFPPSPRMPAGTPDIGPDGPK